MARRPSAHDRVQDRIHVGPEVPFPSDRNVQRGHRADPVPRVVAADPGQLLGVLIVRVEELRARLAVVVVTHHETETLRK